MKPGIYPGISNYEYHSGPGISHSGLDELRITPKHYFHKYRSEHADFSGDKKALRQGTAFHTLILEPHKFDDEIIAQPKIDRRTNVGKAQFAEFQLEAEGMQIIPESELDEVRLWVAAIQENPSMQKLFDGEGLIENSVYWEDPETGVLCRCRPDFLRSDGNVIDFKTARDCSENGWYNAVKEWGYHRAADWYLTGLRANGIDAENMIFIAQEKTAPHVSALRYIPEELMELGNLQNRIALRRYAECLKSGKWPGYSEKIEATIVKPWDIKQLAELRELVNG